MIWINVSESCHSPSFSSAPNQLDSSSAYWFHDNMNVVVGCIAFYSQKSIFYWLLKVCLFAMIFFSLSPEQLVLQSVKQGLLMDTDMERNSRINTGMAMIRVVSGWGQKEAIGFQDRPLPWIQSKLSWLTQARVLVVVELLYQHYKHSTFFSDLNHWTAFS